MKIKGLDHFAWRCRNLDDTIHFYQEILQLPMIHRIDKDYVPSTGEYCPYSHFFFEMQDGSNIAFFYIGDDSPIITSEPDWLIHFAMGVSSKEEVDQWKERLESFGIETLGPINHDGFLTSLYFMDPNDLRLEIAYRNRDYLK